MKRVQWQLALVRERLQMQLSHPWVCYNLHHPFAVTNGQGSCACASVVLGTGSAKEQSAARSCPQGACILIRAAETRHTQIWDLSWEVSRTKKMSWRRFGKSFGGHSRSKPWQSEWVCMDEQALSGCFYDLVEWKARHLARRRGVLQDSRSGKDEWQGCQRAREMRRLWGRVDQCGGFVSSCKNSAGTGLEKWGAGLTRRRLQMTSAWRELVGIWDTKKGITLL